MKIYREYNMTLVPETTEERLFLDSTIPAMFRHTNPKREKALRRSPFSKEPKFIDTFDKKKDGSYQLYKANYQIIEKMKEQRIRMNFIDLRCEGMPIEVKSTVKPRDSQQELCIGTAMDWFSKFGYGCLNCVTGFGKTYVSTNIITKAKVKTLIIVDQNMLADQWIESLMDYTDIKTEDIGFIKGGAIDYKGKKVIIGMAQTLIRKPEICKEISEEIGLVIFDEVHIASCNTFQELIPRFKPKYQLGLSGSHDRDDKMEFMIKESVGPIIYSSDRQKAIDDGSVVQPILWPIFLEDEANFEKNNREGSEFREVVDNMYMDERAIRKVVNVSKRFYDKGESMLFICKEKQMIYAYYETILNAYLVTKEEKTSIEMRRDEEISILRTKMETLDELQKGKHTKTREMEIKKVYNQLLKMKDSEWYELPFAKDIAPKMKECVTLIGDDNPNFREEVLAKARVGEVKIIISSTLFDKAISVSRLKILFLTYSTRERANLIQRVG